MENLYEYLISKENKDKIGKSLFSVFQPGDIIAMTTGACYICVTPEDLKSYMNGQYYIEKMNKSLYILIRTIPFFDYVSEKMYDKNFNPILKSAHTIKKIYRGNKNDFDINDLKLMEKHMNRIFRERKEIPFEELIKK